MRRLAAYEPESVLVISGPVGKLDDDATRRIAVYGLREVAATAREAGVRLGLEPIHPSQRETVSFVNSISDAVALLEEAGLDDVGVMADTYNLWEEAPAAVAAVAGRVTGLHVADVPSEPGRDDRVLPGEGGSRSAELVRALVVAGWDGFFDVEIFSTPERFWGLPVDEAARRAHAAISGLAQTVP
jgi:sugar phosphate isomerase/epimerase